MPKADNPEDKHPATAPREVLELVARFEQQLSAYKSGQYNEVQLRQEFLNPLFKALGWDMDNEQGYAEAYKDVIHEDAIRIGGAVMRNHPRWRLAVGTNPSGLLDLEINRHHLRHR